MAAWLIAHVYGACEWTQYMYTVLTRRKLTCVHFSTPGTEYPVTELVVRVDR